SQSWPTSVASFTFWAAGSDGSSQYRNDYPAVALKWRGHQTWVSQQLGPQHFDVDVLVGSRVALPGAVEVWQKIKDRGGTRLVLERDLDYFHNHPSNQSAKEFWTTHLLNGLAEAMKLADIV